MGVSFLEKQNRWTLSMAVLWLRNNASTFVSQAIDTVVFVTVAFYGVFEHRG
ncbi:MAG: VUT family protein [Calditrichia bacterium]